MRMQKTDVEFVLFDARDVILTSGGGGGHDDDMLTMIWLSSESITNFNILAGDGAKLSMTFNDDAYDWIAYSGAINKKRTTYASVKGLDEPDHPTSGIYTVRKGIQSDYDDVLAWLQKHSPTQ